jgi:hypothetical protein
MGKKPMLRIVAGERDVGSDRLQGLIGSRAQDEGRDTGSWADPHQVPFVNFGYEASGKPH